MPYIVLAAWIIQSAVGVSLFIGWLRHGHHGAPTVITHVGSAIIGLALWIGFVITGALLPAWLAFAVITVGNSFGDVMLVRRHRRTAGATASYGSAIGAVLRGRMPPRVLFHACFAGVVYFLCLGVSIGATVAAAD
ncbi:hypothetical protein [Glaciibacter superstes]|uniref:hypothetical protein n=1 Tax=Glaciibacter superstes TaxID=501023 RepID=UPI0003B6DB4F|nr:hypothetical protein [Glaciibacter superstes]